MSRTGPFFRRAAPLALVLVSACAQVQQEPGETASDAAAHLVSHLIQPGAAPRAAPPAVGTAPSEAPDPRSRAPRQIRGIYLNPVVVGSPARLAAMIDLADRTEINTFVIDVKTESGMHYPSGVRLAREITPAANLSMDDPAALVRRLHEHDIWAVARVVVFKDLKLTRARPEWSIRRPDGGIWKDRAGNTWVSAWDREVWELNLAVAEEAARAGFDEIQFDYVRFPEAYKSLPRQVHPEADGERTDAIAGFLREARERLHPFGVTVTADVFGMAMNDAGDVGIGQQWERISAVTDHILPMVYPSHYMSTHLPGVARPNRMPYETIRTAVGMGVIRNQRMAEAGIEPARVIPWLQGFSAPWVDRDFTYGPAEARAQIRAVYEVGLEDWIFWHPGSDYDALAAVLEPRTEPRAKRYDPPADLVRRMDRYEEWGMAASRRQAAEKPM